MAAQKTKPPAYFYTPASENFFTDIEMDSLLHSITANIFLENLIPSSLFEEKYPIVKGLLLQGSKNNIITAFKTIEKNQQKKIITDKGAQKFTDNKQLYLEALRQQIRKTFSSSTVLSQYLSFNNSDHITYFNSTVRVGIDGRLLVTEIITIRNGDGRPDPIYGNDPSLLDAGSMNNDIKRGIFRTFPLYYVNKYKLFQNTTFKLKEVLRDGKKESSRIEKNSNGLLVYTGRSDYFLPAGNYTYSISYETDKQLKLLGKFDELYWNVTGNSWGFRIDSAKCTVILPKGAVFLSNKCYTGLQGAANEDCRFTSSIVGGNNIIVFKTTKPLLPNQGITIATSWPKGFVKNPGVWKEIKYYIWNNKAVFFLPIAALFSAIFCFIFWWRYGRDPKQGTVYPQFVPPAGYSPAAIGYIYYQKFDRQLTAATIIDAAVRNKIKIEVERDGWLFKHNEYKISRGEIPIKPTESKYEDFENDVEDLIDTTIEKGKYNSDLGSLNKAVEQYCEKNYKNKDGLIKKGYKGFFSLNNSYTTIPILIYIAAGVWGFFGGLVKAMLLKNFWQIAYFTGGIILCVWVLKIFSRLLTTYSPGGRKLMDSIEGFRMFLSTADEHRFDTMAPPKKSLELYEKYLPFAIALGCEIEWGQKFKDIIETAYLDGKGTSSFTQSFSRHNESMGSSFGSSFSGAISSASSPPSSSSGGGSSFGGGSSGGGGGGGGGGGW